MDRTTLQDRVSKSHQTLPICWRGACNNSVARSIGIVPAAISSVSASGSCSHRSSSDADRHPAAHGCTAVNATAVDAAAIDTAVVSANPTNANATNSSATNACSIGEGVS
jgi:hypothetical protein